MFLSAYVFGTRETRNRGTILRGAYRSASITALKEGARIEAARRLSEVAVRRDTGESSTGAERTGGRKHVVQRAQSQDNDDKRVRPGRGRASV